MARTPELAQELESHPGRCCPSAAWLGAKGQHFPSQAKREGPVCLSTHLEVWKMGSERTGGWPQVTQVISEEDGVGP